jgi:hypothetical protein
MAPEPDGTQIMQRSRQRPPGSPAGAYGGPRSVAIGLLPEFYQAAYDAAVYQEREFYKNPMAARNSYYTDLERLCRGLLCQLAFACWLGVDWRAHMAGLYEHPRLGEPDVGCYEVKFMGWRKAEHMDNQEGGHLFVVAHSKARYQVGMTAFDSTMRDRVFVEGWIATADALRFPRGYQSRGRAGKPHVVPYAALSPWEEK